MEEIHLGGKRSRKEEDEGGGGRVAIGGMTFLPWQNPASRICRVSRASGGKDRHSKVLTAKGLRDRRVRLSVSTAIQFYDLQDRLGYDQPSKAVEWLIKAASTAISELPSLDSAFAELSTRFARRSSSSAAADENGHDAADAPPQVIPPNDQRHNPQHVSLTRSTCSSNSETSRGSVLSLSRSENRRAKARERAKERCAAREKGGGGGEGGEEDDAVGGSSHQLGCNRHPVSQCSFTDLLTGSGCNDSNMVTVAAQANNTDNNGNNYSSRHVRHLAPAVTADYFGQGSIAQQKPPPHHHVVPASAQAAHFANGSPVGVMPFNFALATTGGGGDGEHHSEIHHHHQQQQQQLPFLQDHIIPVVASGGDYNLNFSISSSGGLAAFNRGTLQSNSPSLMSHIHHLQRLSSSQADGSNLPFFFGAPHLPAASASGENPFPAAIDGRLQICYGDSYRHSDIKGKGEN